MTNECESQANEHSQLERIINFRFPHRYKKLGLIGAVLVIIFLIGYKFYGGNMLITKDVCRTLMLFLLLIASLSKDVIEDEYIDHVRAQSYIIAFICSVSYAIVLPLIALILDFLITRITGDGTINFYEISAFEVIFMLVCFQLLCFEGMKRFGRAQ